MVVGGSGFTGTTSVNLAGETIQFVAASDSQITVTIPADIEAGQTSLTITTKNGTATVSFAIV